jgi:hypothetical protein
MKWLDRITLGKLLQGLLFLLLLSVWWGVWTAPSRSSALHRSVGFAVAWSLVTFVVLALISRRRRLGREQHIDRAVFPRHLKAAVRKVYPALTDPQLADIERGLRQFFHCHLRARGFVSMPSHAVDAMWHAFILDTRAYGRFCQAAFGHFLHHSPAETLGRDAKRNDGLRRTWYHACKLEGIDPRAPATLPLLFALDTTLAIPGGFRYVPDCRRIDQAAGSGDHCGTSFGDGSASGDASGFGGEAGSGSGDGDGGGDGGGCGGGGD